MTMHIFFNQDKDGYKKDSSCYVERSLARRFCENGIAIPYQKHLDNVYDAEQADIKAKETKKAEKKKAEQQKKDALLKAKETKKAETADSKKPAKAEKAVKK